MSPAAGPRTRPLPDGILLVDRVLLNPCVFPVEPPPPRVDLLPMTSPAGGPVPPLTSRLNARYEVCASLAAGDEVPVSLTFGLELAANGSPRRAAAGGSRRALNPISRAGGHLAASALSLLP